MDKVWGSGYVQNFRVMSLQIELAMNFLLPHSHSQETATRAEEVGLTMEAICRKAYHTC